MQIARLTFEVNPHTRIDSDQAAEKTVHTLVRLEIHLGRAGHFVCSWMEGAEQVVSGGQVNGTKT
jgi:hypothetical protein